ncbi:hypothetical protein RHS03_05942, partial [Rhizoctonia solani]
EPLTHVNTMALPSATSPGDTHARKWRAELGSCANGRGNRGKTQVRMVRFDSRRWNALFSISSKALGSSLRGPENLRSAPRLAIVDEHSGASTMTLRSARGVHSSARRAIQIRRILTKRFPKSERPGALQSFWGPRGVVTVILLATTRSLFLVGEDRGMLLDDDPRMVCSEL